MKNQLLNITELADAIRIITKAKQQQNNPVEVFIEWLKETGCQATVTDFMHASYLADEQYLALQNAERAWKASLEAKQYSIRNRI